MSRSTVQKNVWGVMCNMLTDVRHVMLTEPGVIIVIGILFVNILLVL